MRVVNQCLEILELPQVTRFGWIVIDTASPAMHIRLLLCPENLLKQGILDHNLAINELQYCMETDEWNGYSDGIETLELPEWAKENK